MKECCDINDRVSQLQTSPYLTRYKVQDAARSLAKKRIAHHRAELEFVLEKDGRGNATHRQN